MSRVHGGILQFGDAADVGALDLSVNINPYGPHPDVTACFTADLLTTYPDPHSQRLSARIATTYACKPEQVLIGNGASEILWAAIRSLLRRNEGFLYFEPSFSEAVSAARQVGSRILKEAVDAQFYLDPERIAEKLAFHRPKIFYLCNPNSPTGSYLPAAAVLELALQFPQCCFLLDESFLSLSEHWQDFHRAYPPNVLRIVSLTKDHAIPGLRLGFAIGTEALIARVKAEIPSWNVNAYAQAAGCFLWDKSDFLSECRTRILLDRRQIEAEFLQRGIPFLPSTTCFLMFKGDPRLGDVLWREAKIYLRSCASYGYPEWWRMAARPAASLRGFWQAWDLAKNILKEKG